MSSTPNSFTKNVTAKIIAEHVLVWAKSHNLFGKAPLTDAIEDVSADCFAQPAMAFSNIKVENILRQKSINLVAFNENLKKIFIFTNGKINKTDESSLPFHFSGYTFEYIQGGIASVKGTPPAPEMPAPFGIHGERYTCGSSVYPANCIGAGTMGLLAKDKEGRIYGMTNNHVAGACNNAMPGLPILAPGPLDANEEACDPFTIGRHSRLLPILDGIPENIDISRNWDVSIFEITDSDTVTSMQGSYFDTPSTVISPASATNVKKVGRTTGLTTGKIIGQSASPIPVSYNVPEHDIKKTVFFDTVYVVAGDNDIPFSRPGDSGALVVAEDEKGVRTAIGIVFAGNEARNHTFILPLSEIFEKLSLTIVTQHNV